MTFVLEKFIQDCKNMFAEPDAQGAIREILLEAISTPAEVVNALGEPRLAGLETLYHADDLTILNIVWAADPGWRDTAGQQTAGGKRGGIPSRGCHP